MVLMNAVTMVVTTIVTTMMMTIYFFLSLTHSVSGPFYELKQEVLCRPKVWSVGGLGQAA